MTRGSGRGAGHPPTARLCELNESAGRGKGRCDAL